MEKQKSEEPWKVAFQGATFEPSASVWTRIELELDEAQVGMMKQRFQGATFEPSASVWTNVELELEKAQLGMMKKRVLMYQLLAAASLVFALGIGGVYYLSGPQELSSDQLSVVGENQESGTSSENPLPEVKRNDGSTNDNATSLNKQANQPIKKDQPIGQKSDSYISTRDSDNKDSGNETRVWIPITRGEERTPPPFWTFENPKLKIEKNQSTADPGMVLLARLEDEEKKYREEEDEKKIKEKIWTSLGFGAGSFNPNSSSSSQSAFGGSSSNPTSGTSYSLGVSVGGKLSRRLVLQGGVSYLSQNASFTSSAVSMNAVDVRAALNEFASNNLGIVATSPYDVNSNLQYVSLPVLAGYVVLDRSFAIQLNGGVATDFFIQNTLTPENSSVGKVSQGPGEDSPYRSVNFNGLLGTEFSYKFHDRYRVAVNPGLRYALNSIYKSDVSAEISPITYEVALRFRYIFK